MFIDVEHGSNSDQPNDETQALAIDDKNTAAIGSSSSKKSEDAIEKLDSEVAGNILNEDKTEGVEVVSGDKEEGGGAGMPDDLEVAPDQSEVKDEVQDQDSGAVEASNESEQDQKEDAQVVGENVEPSASGESKTDPTKDKTGKAKLDIIC